MIKRGIFKGMRPPYDFIMADPPWTFKTYSAKGVTEKSAGGQYDVMTLEDIAAMPIRSLAAENCLVWLWCTHPMLPQALDILDAWGARFATSGVWGKRTIHGKQAFGTGFVLRCASEPFLIGKFGSPRTTRTVRTLIEGQIREHSRKPDEAYAAAEALMPDAARRADLFARERRPGWDAWGHEVDKFTAPVSVRA